MNKREMRHSSPPNYVKSKIWNRFKIKILVSFGFLFALLLSLATPINSIEGSNTVEADTTETRAPFTVPETYTDGNVTIKFDVSGYLVNGSLSQTDDVKIVIYDPPVNPPAAQIWSANAVAGLPVGSAEKNGNNYTYTFTADRLISSDIFSQDGEMTVSLGATEFKISKDGVPITVKAPRLKINYVDTDGYPLDNPPTLSEVSNADLQENSDDIFDGKIGRLDGQVDNIPGYTFRIEQSTLTVPGAANPDLDTSIYENDGSLFKSVKAILDDPVYGGGQIKEGSVLNLVYENLNPFAKISKLPANFDVDTDVTREQLIKATVQKIELRDGTSVTDYENLTFSGSVIKPDGNLDTSKKGDFVVAITYHSDKLKKSVTVKTNIKIRPVFKFTVKYVDENGRELHPPVTSSTDSESGYYQSAYFTRGDYLQYYGNSFSLEKSKYEVNLDGKVVKSEIGLAKYGSDWQTIVNALEYENSLSPDIYSNAKVTEFTVTKVYVKPTATMDDITVNVNQQVDIWQLLPGITLSNGLKNRHYLVYASPIIDTQGNINTSKRGDFKISATYLFDGVDDTVTAEATIHVLPEINLVTNYVDENGKRLKTKKVQTGHGSDKLSFDTTAPTIKGRVLSLKKSTFFVTLDGQKVDPPGDVFLEKFGVEHSTDKLSDILTQINSMLNIFDGVSNTTYTLKYVYVPQQTAVLTIDGQAEETVNGEADDEITFAKTDDQLVRGGYSYTVKGPDDKQYASLADALKANDKYDDSTVTTTGEDSHKQVFDVVYKQIPQTGITLKNQSFMPLLVVSFVGLVFFVFRKLKRIK